ncbi:MAG TPA: hypothetical protein VKR54_04730 [Candidatus Babeliales bacterium]|nr:hypothetical protein [Candidatus Babeliales bacterium]
MKMCKVIVSVVTLFFMSQTGAMMESRVVREKKPGLLNSKLTTKQQKEFRGAIKGMRDTLIRIQNSPNPSPADIKTRNEQQKIVDKYLKLHGGDSFVVEKMEEHAKFLRKLQKLKASQIGAQSQVMPAECCVCLEEKSTVKIPCKNEHSDRICQSCLDDIMQHNGLCPICRAELIK